jgi:hypothetical protein
MTLAALGLTELLTYGLSACGMTPVLDTFLKRHLGRRSIRTSAQVVASASSDFVSPGGGVGYTPSPHQQ